MDLYAWVRGPLAWVAIMVFCLGSLHRLLSLFVIGKGEPMLYPGRSVKGGVRSILRGVLPFGTAYMRKRPLFTITAFVFHVCILILPVFVLAHTLSWYESWRILWWSIPESLADVMTILVVLCCLFFLGRRLLVAEARQVTRATDFLILTITVLPFLTGFLAYHQWGPYKPMLILHILTGEILLVTVPFSRLRHMLFFVFTRGYMGAEYGRLHDSRDW